MGENTAFPLWLTAIVLYGICGFLILVMALEDIADPQNSDVYDGAGFWKSIGSLAFLFFCGPGLAIGFTVWQIAKSIGIWLGSVIMQLRNNTV